MITLDNNKLSFTFPEIAAELKRLAHAEVDRRTALFLAENRASAFAAMVRRHYRFHSITDDYKRSAMETLVALTPEAIQSAIRKFAGNGTSFGTETQPDALATVTFQRTLRIPDDGKKYPLPPGLGNFPLVHVDDHAQNVPPAWNKRGGVMMPMYQAEALWIRFGGSYPCAIKVGTGKINAVSGQPWSAGLHRAPQDYLALPGQPWLDGYCVGKGAIRQFIAMPLGDGYTAEEQITGQAEHGGLQLQVYPVKAAVHFETSIKPGFPGSLADILPSLLPVPPRDETQPAARASSMKDTACIAIFASPARAGAPDMGLGAGGLMHQEIYEDARDPGEYEMSLTSRCFVHLCNSAAWKTITGARPPQPPVTAQTYAQYGLPWFDYYRDDLAAVEGSKQLASLKTVGALYGEKEAGGFPGNETVVPTKLVQYGHPRRPQEVIEWRDEEELR